MQKSTPFTTKQSIQKASMVTNMQLSFLKNVKPHKTIWCLQVEVIHSWIHYSKIAGDSLELILSNAHVSVKFYIDLRSLNFYLLRQKLTIYFFNIFEGN